MFMNVDHIRAGVLNYAYDKVLPSLEPGQQFLAGTALGIFSSKASELLGYVADMPVIKALGVVENGTVDVDVLYAAVTEQMKRQGTVCFDIPLIGRITMEQGDIRELYDSIKRG